MKNKLFFLSTIISSCILTIACNQSTADELHPNMPSGKRPCYPSSKCTGDPNLIGPRGGCSGNMGQNGNYGDQNGQMMNQGMNGNGNMGYSNPNGYSGYGAPTGKVLQTDSAEKFTGTVRSINRVNLPNQTQIQMVLSTERGDLLIIVGPSSFIDQQKIKFAAGDKVVVTGYRIKANGKEVITAAQIQRNGNTLQLLNEKRQPMWGSAK